MATGSLLLLDFFLVLLFEEFFKLNLFEKKISCVSVLKYLVLGAEHKMHVCTSSTRLVTASLTFSFGVEHHAETDQGTVGSAGTVTVTVTGSWFSPGSSWSSRGGCQTTRARARP